VHTRAYSVGQMTMGTVKDDQAAGRVFCNYTQGLEYMVWTQNDSRMMSYVADPAYECVGLVGRHPPQHRHRRPHEHVTTRRRRGRGGSPRRPGMAVP
jgi:hypothetical protein